MRDPDTTTDGFANCAVSNGRGCMVDHAGRGGFTLVELLTVVGVTTLLLSMLLPTLARAREQAKRASCANNLRQIGQAIHMYANGEKNGGFPRTFYDVDWSNGSHQSGSGAATPSLSNVGFADGSTPLGSFDMSGSSNPNHPAVNSVGASFFLLLKTEELSPETFFCPSSGLDQGFQGASVQGSNNFGGWGAGSNGGDLPVPAGYLLPDCGYSFQNPFPTAAGAAAGFRWNSSLDSEAVICGDVNPGKAGTALGRTGGVNTVFPTASLGNSTSPANYMFWGNSTNHKNQGQNVLYGDAHVEWQSTCFCGAYRHLGTSNYRDNIYVMNTPQDAVDSDLEPAQNR